MVFARNQQAVELLHKQLSFPRPKSYLEDMICISRHHLPTAALTLYCRDLPSLPPKKIWIINRRGKVQYCWVVKRGEGEGDVAETGTGSHQPSAVLQAWGGVTGKMPVRKEPGLLINSS